MVCGDGKFVRISGRKLSLLNTGNLLLAAMGSARLGGKHRMESISALRSADLSRVHWNPGKKKVRISDVQEETAVDSGEFRHPQFKKTIIHTRPSSAPMIFQLE